MPTKALGLGHEFLRHVERCRVLVHLVEPAPVDGTCPIENYAAIRKELLEYDAPLAERPEVVAVTKAELPEAQEIRARLQEHCGAGEVHLISAVTGEGLKKLLGAVVESSRSGKLPIGVIRTSPGDFGCAAVRLTPAMTE